MTSNPSSPASPLEDISPQTAGYERYVVGCDLGQSHDPTAIAVVRRIDDDAAVPVARSFKSAILNDCRLARPIPALFAMSRACSARRRCAASRSWLSTSPASAGRCSICFRSRRFADRRHDHGRRRGDARGHDLPGAEARSDQPRAGAPARRPAENPQGFARCAGAGRRAARLPRRGDRQRLLEFGARSGKHDDLVLAVAIALWRAHGDNMPGYGVFELYRREAEKVGHVLPAPKLPPAPPLDFGFQFTARAKPAEPGDWVTLKPPHGPARSGLRLGSFQLMLQSSQFDGVAFDPFSFQKDGLASAEVDVGRR